MAPQASSVNAMSESLIPAETLERVGEVLSGPVTTAIDRREAQRYAYAVGDEITATVRLAAVDQKEGRKGPFVRQVRKTTFVNQFGYKVARSRMIGIAR